MTEPIQQAEGEVAIVIYDSPLPPRYFRLSKKFIKYLFVVSPLLMVLAFSGLFLWGLAMRVKEAPRPSLPTVLSERDSKVMALESELKSLQQSNQELTDKLSGAPSTTTDQDPFLLAVKKPYGMQNLTSQNKVGLDQFELTQESGKSILKFQIISTSPETKVTGHVLVYMLAENGMSVWPREANVLMDQGIKFSSGEPFSVSRLRPTRAEFSFLPAGNMKFSVYIFSREGDLLLVHTTENLKAGK